MSRQQDMRNQKYERLKNEKYDVIFGVITLLFIIVVIWCLIDPVPTYQGIH